MNEKVGFISLGCPKNQVDTEIMLGLLDQRGYVIVNRAEEADIVVVNTCGFITPAKEEAIDTLLEMARLKEIGKLKYLVATGCLAQRYGRELLKEIPELDAVVGVSSFTSITDVLDRLRRGERFCLVGELPSIFTEKGPRILSTQPGSAYLKIAEGCDNRCSYCAIPLIRGRFRSRPVMELVTEAEWLAAQGVKELVLVAQDTTMYGQDLFDEPVLSCLLRELARIEGLDWIRVMYAHPARITPGVVEALASEAKVIPYLDLPIQHSTNKILRRMGRGYRGEDILSLLERIRREVPGLVVRTTVMVGFPGESEEDFTSLCSFVATAKFDWLGVFAYCQEEGTPAGAWEDTVAAEVKEARKARILDMQKPITYRHNQSRLGKVEKILVGGVDGRGQYWGRGYYQAPGVDGITLLNTTGFLKPGQIVEARLVDVSDYDLIGEVTRGEPA